MDPITGVVALTGFTIAAIAGLRLKKNLNEGFEVLPSVDEDINYPESIKESQTRYNPLMSLVNPILNPVAPVGSNPTDVEKKQGDLNTALGNLLAPYDPNSPEALRIKDFMNRFRVRTDSEGGLYDAIKFCRDEGASGNPYSTYRTDDQGNLIKITNGKFKEINSNETLKFDEVCGVCLTSGIDEDGKPFTGRKGMLVDPSVVESAIKEQKDFSYPFPRVAPSLGKCEGSPASPSFAVNNETLNMYSKRIECMKTKEISESNNCGLCYENDTFSYVPGQVNKNTISFVLMGTGLCAIKANNLDVKKDIILSDTTPISVPLVLNQDVWTFDYRTRRWTVTKRVSSVQESDSFEIKVTQDPTKPDEFPILYGYLSAINPNGGRFAMPLNIIITTDDVTKRAPNRTGGFHQFPENGIEVAKIRPAGESGKEMILQGAIPFTFVQSSEFSAIDCPSAPYQTKTSSVTRFSTDQPCFQPGASQPGTYNDACLRERILDAGCTNAGELYKNPKVLNKDESGKARSLSQIYAVLRDFASKDMMAGEDESTRMCSGRTIASPCEYFISRPTLKLERILNGSDTANKASIPGAKKCLSYLYHNRGGEQLGAGSASYRGMTSYQNDTLARKKIYCLPEGDLNPDKTADAMLELARIYDMGYNRAIGVEGVTNYLTSILEMAVDTKRNANTDVERKSAIRKCFGTNFTPLQMANVDSGNPRVEPDPPKFTIKSLAGASWRMDSNQYLRLRSGTVIDVDLVARPDIFKSSAGRVGLFVGGNPSKALRHSGLVVFASPFLANNYDFAWYPIKGDGNAVFFYNDYNNGMFMGYDATNDTFLLVAKEDSRRASWIIEPYPSTLVKTEPTLLAVPKPQDSLPTSFIPRTGTLLGRAQVNGDYKLTMTINPTRPNVGWYVELVHFTITGADCCTPGDRMPAIWFTPNSTRLHIRIGDTTDGNWGVDTQSQCFVGQANTFSLECRGSDVTVMLNTETIRIRQPTRRPIGLAQVYGTTSYYAPAMASISNFKFLSLN